MVCRICGHEEQHHTAVGRYSGGPECLSCEWDESQHAYEEGPPTDEAIKWRRYDARQAEIFVEIHRKKLADLSDVPEEHRDSVRFIRRGIVEDAEQRLATAQEALRIALAAREESGASDSGTV